MHAVALKYFVTVARTGSIRKASAELDVTGSAISRQIKRIEDDAQLPLFDRLPSGLRLTEAGTILLTHFQHTLREYDLLLGEFAAMSGIHIGTVRIVSIDCLFYGFLAEQIASFNETHPRVCFEIERSNAASIGRMISSGGADIGLTFKADFPEDVDFESVTSMPIVAVVAPNHPLAKRRSVTFSECVQHGLALPYGDQFLGESIGLEQAKSIDSKDIVLRTMSFPLILSLVVAGRAVSFATPFAIDDELRTGEVVALPLEDLLSQRLEIGITVPRNRTLSNAVTELRNQFKAGLLNMAAEKSIFRQSRPGRR